MLKLQSWASYCLEAKPQILLGGYRAEDVEAPAMLEWFWSNYKHVNENHPVFIDHAGALGSCIPYMVHGDEGRGLRRRPFMVISIQPCIGHLGPEVCNESTLSGGSFLVSYILNL